MLQAAASASGWSVMASGKSAAKIRHNHRLQTVVVSDFAKLLCGKSYDRVERLAGLPSKIRHYQRDASVLLILADIFGAC